MYTAKEYSEILKTLLTMEIKELFADPRYNDSDYLRGQVVGLIEALNKINNSQFLTE